MKQTVIFVIAIIAAMMMVAHPASARPKGDNDMSLAAPSNPSPDRPKRNDGPAIPNPDRPKRNDAPSPERPKRNDAPSNPFQWILDLITNTGYSK